MATADTGTSIDNFEGNAKFNNKQLYLSRCKEIVEVLEVVAADSDGDVLLVCPIHSSWRIVDIMVMNDAITSGTDYDIGIHKTTAEGGTVVDANAYADAVDMSSARTAWTSVGFEIRGIEKAEQQVWQDAGLSSDPQEWYYLSITAVTVGSADGTIAVRVIVADGS